LGKVPQRRDGVASHDGAFNMEKIADLRRQRAAAFDAFKVLADKPELTDAERTDYTDKEKAIRAFDDQIKRAQSAQALSGASAQPVDGQQPRIRVHATPETDPYVNDDAAMLIATRKGAMPGSARSLVLGGMIQMAAAGNGNIMLARQAAVDTYGEAHPVTRALIVSTGAAGGFIVPPDYMNEIIELLRPQSVVRASNPRVIPMPRGTMTLPGQASAATASYGTETGQIASSQQTLDQIVASYKKLTALVPVSNDLMRYADPAVDAFVRDDLVKVVALRQDLAFILGDGTASTPMGFLYFANRWVGANGGTVGKWLTTAASVEAVNGTDPANSTGGNFITSTYAFTLATVANELGGAVNRLDTANVPDSRRVWFMNPRSRNYLFNVQNSLGVYVYRDELSKGTLLGYPVRVTTQIGTNYYDANSHTNTSFVFLVEMDEAMLLDSMSLELAVSREGSYVDANSNTVSAFQNDQTLVRAIAEHDFQMRHDQSVAVIQAVAWAPAIS
jgi:HK97 family phage major capsid protein